MTIWTIPRKATVELNADGWCVCIRRRRYHFNTHAECLCYLAGRGLIEYEQIDFLIRAARERLV